MANENLSPDIYRVNDYVEQLKKEFTPDVNEETLMLGIFGYTGQIFSDMFQNTIVMASEFSNESIPTKAKFEKNIIAHALGYGISNINAVPAQMEVLLTFIEDDIIKWAEIAHPNKLPSWEFVFDKDNKIYFGNYEFHTDYDILIRKIETTTQGTDKKFAYTAQYNNDDFEIGNGVSDLTNRYLTPPVKMNIYGTDVIMVKCTIRQVEKTIQETKILSDNDVASKTCTFTFDGNLASFSLDVTEGNEKYHMIPVYEGLNVDTRGHLYFWYTYLDTSTIRIKFDRNSRIPSVNATITINLQTTQGSKGNFTFYGEDYPEFVFESERLNYSNITCQVRPTTGDAINGADKKSIEDLKEIIPVEALSRGSITNTRDLENFFNALDSSTSKLYFFKKRDNCLERLYYSFLLMKDDLNIVPTNTLDIVVDPGALQIEEGSGKYMLKQGQVLILSPDGTEARLLKPEEVLPDEDGSTYDGRFAYYLPYNFIINKSPLYGAYVLTTIHGRKVLDFEYINEKCLYQYISTNIRTDRNCLENHNTYKMSIDLIQNIIPSTDNDADPPVHIDEETGALVSDIDVYMIVYNEDNLPHRWAKASVVDYDESAAKASFEFTFTTEDYIDSYNRIRIDSGLYDINSMNESYAHLRSNTPAKIFIVSKQGESYGLGNPSLTKYIPNLTSDMSLSNAYSVLEGIDWFYDYSDIISSTVVASEDEITESGDIIYPGDPESSENLDPDACDCADEIEDIQSNLTWKTSIEDPYKDPNFNDKNANLIDDDDEVAVTTALRYHVRGVPVVKYGYLSDEEIAKNFFNELVNRKIYIDKAVLRLEDAFEMDFKFFNTYGPSKFFTWDNAVDVVDRVNVSLFFKLKLKPNYDSNIVEDIRMDIKNYVEDINNIRSLHIPNLITEITNTYKDSIEFFEFVSINGYDAGHQHIYSMDIPDGIMVPEFINVNTLPDRTPDIIVDLV